MGSLVVVVLLFPAIMIHAAVGDLMTMRIPNRVISVLLASYIVAVPILGLTLSDVLWALAAAAAVFAFGLISFCCHWMGGGDVKLLTIAGLWLGAANVVPFIFYTSMFGAMLTLLILIFRQAPLPVAWRGRDWLERLHRRDAGVPYGVAIAAAGVLVYLRTPWVAAQF